MKKLSHNVRYVIRSLPKGRNVVAVVLPAALSGHFGDLRWALIRRTSWSVYGNDVCHMYGFAVLRSLESRGRKSVYGGCLRNALNIPDDAINPLSVSE